MRGARQSLTPEPSGLGAQEPSSGPEAPLWMAALCGCRSGALGPSPCHALSYLCRGCFLWNAVSVGLRRSELQRGFLLPLGSQKLRTVKGQ